MPRRKRPAEPMPDMPPEVLGPMVEAEFRRLRPLLPDIDEGDLLCILNTMLRPIGAGHVFFLREARPGVYVF